MNKYENFIYMTICEITLVTYKDTGYSNHSSYCRDLAFKFKDNSFQNKDKIHIGIIIKKLDELFSMSTEDVANYIFKYFVEEKFLLFEKPVRLVEEYFPMNDKILNIKALHL